jgi:hypothetical protein
MSMAVHWIGLVAAGATFLGIWLGHVAVRKIEFNSPTVWFPAVIAVLLGLLCEIGAVLSANVYLNAALGILGVTFLWDAFEFWRQGNRVRHGHAPANPDNPRHAQILAESAAATTTDLLNRDPIGRPVRSEEALRRVTEKQGTGS